MFEYRFESCRDYKNEHCMVLVLYTGHSEVRILYTIEIWWLGAEREFESLSVHKRLNGGTVDTLDSKPSA